MGSTRASVDRFAHLADEGFIERCYALLLHRAPEAGGLEHYLSRLRHGDTRELVWEAMANDAAAAPATSSGLVEAPLDLSALMALSDREAFVGAAYLLVLGRPADAAGAKSYAAAIARGTSKSTVLLSLYASAEARARHVRLPELELLSDAQAAPGLAARSAAQVMSRLRRLAAGLRGDRARRSGVV
jgi:hypothetical protein